MHTEEPWAKKIILDSSKYPKFTLITGTSSQMLTGNPSSYVQNRLFKLQTDTVDI